MLNKYAAKQIFNIAPSIFVLKGVVSLHIIASFSLILNSFSGGYKGVLFTLLLISAWHCFTKEKKKAFMVRLNSLYGWEISNLGGDFCTILILDSTVVTPYLIILHFKEMGKKQQAILIVKDAMPKETYRQFVVKLNILGLQKG